MLEKSVWGDIRGQGLGLERASERADLETSEGVRSCKESTKNSHFGWLFLCCGIGGGRSRCGSIDGDTARKARRITNLDVTFVFELSRQY